MAFIDGKEKPLASLSTEALIDRFRYPASSKEESIIRKILESRCVLAPIFNSYDLSREPMGIKMLTPFSVFAKPLLDPANVWLGVDPAKDDTELHINVKRHKIKFNFNN